MPAQRARFMYSVLEASGSGAGGSRAAQRRQKKKARQQKSSDVPPPQPATTMAAGSSSLINSAKPSQQPATDRLPLPDAAVVKEIASRPPREEDAASTGIYREWEVSMPAAGEPLFDALKIALAQAATIHGRKYRYGALLLAGDDLIPMKSGSNRKVFLRDNIHAEMSVLKGCDRPRGKDMLIARLAPAKRARSSADVEDDDDSEDGAAGEERARSCGVAGRASAAVDIAVAPLLGSTSAESAREDASLDHFGKMLNARPCARCEAKMVERGVRRCFFTVNSRRVGVLEYNPD